MKPALLALLPAALLLLPAEERIAFHPEPGTSLSKRVEAELSMELDDFTLLVNGEDAAESLGGFEGGTASFVIGVRDRFAAVVDGRPTDLLRTFEELAMSVEEHGTGQVEERDADLDGASVRFVWDEEEEAYVVTLEEGDADEELLQPLSPDMDYRALLPDGPVEVGDRWTVTGAAACGALVPGFDFARLGALLGEGDAPAEIVDALTSLVEAAEIDCVLVSVGESDGARVAEIGLDGEIAGDLELDPGAFVEADGEGLENGAFGASVMLEVEGTLLWDVASGHFRSFELRGSGPLTMEASGELPDLMSEIEMEAEMSLELVERASAARL